MREAFIGEHDRETFSPLPDHISAKAKDLTLLMPGLLKTNSILQQANYNPVLTAASIAFGFVFIFIHPLSDGNGRIHRYIVHHILTRMGYTKRGIIFPISSAILDRINEYQEILEHFSSPRVNLINWKETPDHNIEILNETIDLYRYFDLTRQAEFLYKCVEDTIEKIIPDELDYFEKYDKMTEFINSHVNLPNTEVDLLIKLLDKNNGKLSNKKRKNILNIWTRTKSKLSKMLFRIFLTENKLQMLTLLKVPDWVSGKIDPLVRLVNSSSHVQTAKLQKPFRNERLFYGCIFAKL